MRGISAAAAVAIDQQKSQENEQCMPHKSRVTWQREGDRDIERERERVSEKETEALGELIN